MQQLLQTFPDKLLWKCCTSTGLHAAKLGASKDHNQLSAFLQFRSCVKFPKLQTVVQTGKGASRNKNCKDSHYLLRNRIQILRNYSKTFKVLRSAVILCNNKNNPTSTHPLITRTHTHQAQNLFFISCTWSTLRWHLWPEIPCHNPVTQNDPLYTRRPILKFTSYF